MSNSCMFNRGDDGRRPQDQQDFIYNDGTTQISYSSQQYSWSSSSTYQQSPPQQLHPQSMPQILPISTPMPMLDPSQIHQQHMDLHLASMQMQQNSLKAMRGIAQAQIQPALAHPVQAQQPVLMPAMQMAQIEYTHAFAPPQVLQIESGDIEDRNDMLVVAERDPLAERGRERERKAERQRQADLERQAERDKQAERDRQAEIDRQAARDKRMMEVAQRIENRMQRNDQQTREQAEAQANKEAAQAAKNDQLQKEQLEQIAKVANQLADLQRQTKAAAAAAAQPSSPAFDMGAIEKIVRDAHREDTTSKDDLKQLIEDAVKKQLSDVARASDIESAASRMEKSIERVPKGASDAQVKETVQKELTNAIDKASKHMAAAAQRRIEGQHLQGGASKVARKPRVETEFTVEELPEDDEKAKEPQSSHSKAMALLVRDIPKVGTSDSHPRSHKKVKALAASTPETPAVMPLTAGSLERLQPPEAALAGSKSRHSKGSVVPTDSNAMVRVKHSESKPSKSSTMSTMSAQPSADNALVRPGAEEAEKSRSSSSSKKMSTMSVQPSDNNALVKPRADRPGHAEEKSSSSSRKSAMPVQPSANREASPPDAVRAPQQEHLPKSSSKMSTVSVQPSDTNALVKPSKSSKKSTASLQPSASNAMVRPRSSDTPKFTSSAEAMAQAQARGGQLSAYSGHQGLGELPDDFPDTASQVSSWQSGQTAKQASEGGSKSKIRPKNDHRGKVFAPSPLRQLGEVPELEEDSTALVKQSKDVSKKPRR